MCLMAADTQTSFALSKPYVHQVPGSSKYGMLPAYARKTVQRIMSSTWQKRLPRDGVMRTGGNA